jgi:hypothetical protein
MSRADQSENKRQQSRSTSHVTLLTALVGLVTALVTLAGTVATQMGAFGDTRIPGLPGAPLSCDPRVNPTLSLSTGAGPSGTEVTVTGSDFCAGETVTIRFHTEQIATARADDDGRFGTPARVPGSFDAFAPQQFHIVATGEESLRSARVPFRLTSG